MDPISQGTLGAAAVLAALPRHPAYERASFGWLALSWMGALGGMAADLDVLIRSASDPLLAIEYHRHFTHSLAFVPVGGALAALPWLLYGKARKDFRLVFVASTLGYATHGLLDACTTYGTLLLWPFSHVRVSWSWVSVIDPLFTLPLLAATVLAVRRRSSRWVRLGLLWAMAYLGLGAFQQQRATALQSALARERGHDVSRSAVFPSFANNVTWRSVYQSGQRYYVDKLRVTWTGRSCASPGVSVGVADNEAGGGAAEQRAQRLFRWFSDDWVAYDPGDPTVLGDLRYSFSPLEATPIWGIRTGDAGVEWVNQRQQRELRLSDVWELVAYDGPGARCY